jgi:signal transduction histidine kinase
MGLRIKLFLPLLLAVVLLAAYVHALWLPRLLADAESAYEVSVGRHLESVAEGLVPLLLGHQLDGVYGNLDALLEKNAGWVSIRLFDPEGRSLYPLDPSHGGPGDAHHDVRTLLRKIGYLDMELGTLEVKADFTPRLNEIRSRYGDFLSIFLTVILLFFLATGFVLERVVRRPIRLLADASLRLSGGDFALPLPKPGNDEVGILVDSFAGMRDAIRHHGERLIEINEELRREIVERTKTEEELQRVQEELIRNEKLAVLGQLSGSVGHELRNPLGVMSNAVYFLKTVLADADETTLEYLDIIKKEIDNSRRIIADLLDFARTRPPQTKKISASELIDESFGKCAIPENVALRLDLPATLPPLRVDPLQMGQVLRNLVTNAVQAMPNGGALHVAARLVSSDVGAGLAPAHDPKGQPQGLPLQEFVEISVADTGEGISPENMKKLFQPLFTTKAKGIGLGLVVCGNLTEANGGRIAVESRAGEGTTFSIVLPVEGG